MAPLSNIDSNPDLKKELNIVSSESSNELGIKRNNSSRIVVKHASKENLKRQDGKQTSSNNLTICTSCSVDSFVWTDECKCNENDSTETTNKSDNKNKSDSDDGDDTGFFVFWN